MPRVRPSIALVHREEHLGVVERLNGLRRHVIGITGADADDVNPTSHAREYAASSRRVRSGL